MTKCHSQVGWLRIAYSCNPSQGSEVKTYNSGFAERYLNHAVISPNTWSESWSTNWPTGLDNSVPVPSDCLVWSGRGAFLQLFIHAHLCRWVYHWYFCLENSCCSQTSVFTDKHEYYLSSSLILLFWNFQPSSHGKKNHQGPDSFLVVPRKAMCTYGEGITRWTLPTFSEKNRERMYGLTPGII